MNSLRIKFYKFDKQFKSWLKKWGIPLTRISLGVVFLWFGLLKVFNVSPVVDLISKTYWFLPTNEFIFFLGIWEVLVGIGLIFKLFLRTTLFFLWLQMLGTLTSLFLYPPMFFVSGNLFLLTMEGEFVVKNLVLIAAGLAISGHEVD